MKCWWTMPTPASMASRGEWKTTCSPWMAIVPLSGVIEAGEDVHQRGLAGAVFAQKRVDFAFAHGEGDVIVGDDAGKGLGDVAHFEGEGCFGHASDCPDVASDG